MSQFETPGITVGRIRLKATAAPNKGASAAATRRGSVSHAATVPRRLESPAKRDSPDHAPQVDGDGHGYQHRENRPPATESTRAKRHQNQRERGEVVSREGRGRGATPPPT